MRPDPLFCLWRGEDKTQELRLFGEKGEPVDLTGSFVICNLYARGLSKPVLTLSTIGGTARVAGNGVFLKFSKEVTAKLAPVVYELEILRDPDATGTQERHPIVRGLIKVASMGAF